MMSTAFEPGAPPTIGESRMIFEDASLERVDGASGGRFYDIVGNGERFIMVQQIRSTGPREIHVVLNWFEELKAKVGN